MTRAEPPTRVPLSSAARACRAPGCRKPARNCDKDHRQEWSNNGPSHRGNIDNACRHHHRLRHEHDYHVYRLPDGTYLWQAPNGLIYPVPPHTTLRLTVEGNDGEEIPCEHTKTATGEPWPNLIQTVLPGLNVPSK